MIKDSDRQNYRLRWDIMDCDGDFLRSSDHVLLTAEEAARVRQLMGLSRKYYYIELEISDKEAPSYSGLAAVCRSLGIKAR